MGFFLSLDANNMYTMFLVTRSRKHKRRVDTECKQKTQNILVEEIEELNEIKSDYLTIKTVK